MTVISVPYLARESHNARDSYVKEARSPPRIHVLRIEECPTKNIQRVLEDIVFIEVDTRWVHHPHANALVITIRVANNILHRLLADDGSTIDIIYLDAYKRMRLIESELNPSISPLYGFTGDRMILKGTVKLAVIVGEHPRVSTIVTKFLVVDCPSAINGIIGRPFLKALKAVISIYHLTMKFLTTEGM